VNDPRGQISTSCSLTSIENKDKRLRAPEPDPSLGEKDKDFMILKDPRGQRLTTLAQHNT